MAAGVEGLVQGIVDPTNVPATTKVSPNLRVSVATGTIGVLGDVVTFPGPLTATGTWVSGTLRTTINGLPVITQTAVGASVTVAGPPGGPIRVAVPDTRVSAS